MRVIDEWAKVESEDGTRETAGTNETAELTDERTGGGASVVWSKGAVVGTCEHEAIERGYGSRNQAQGATDIAEGGHEAGQGCDVPDGWGQP